MWLLLLLALCLAGGSRSLPLGDAGPHVQHGWGEPVRLRRLYSQGGLYLSIGSDGRVAGTETQGLHSLLQITAVSVGTVAIKGVRSSRYLCMEEAGRLQGRVIKLLMVTVRDSQPSPELLRCVDIAVASVMAEASYVSPRSCLAMREHFSGEMDACPFPLSFHPGVNDPKRFGKKMLIYSTEDCSFEEELLAGYNAYKSKKYGVLVTLRSARQRQVKGKDSHPFSHFMPMITTMPVESMDFGEYGDSRPSFESHIFNSRLDNDSPDPFGITSDTAVRSPSFGN